MNDVVKIATNNANDTSLRKCKTNEPMYPSKAFTCKQLIVI